MQLFDGALCIIDHTTCALREAFTPDSTYPPLGGGTDKVRVFAGDVMPMEAFDFHTNDPECGCERPFLWVRLMRRYRGQSSSMDSFPNPYVGDSACEKPIVVALEVGIARCAALQDPDGCDWTAYENEAEISLDDSRRLEIALCRAKAKMKQSECSMSVALDAIVPHGPTGGVIGWVGQLYATVDDIND